jgi:hypothetical protein
MCGAIILLGQHRAHVTSDQLSFRQLERSVDIKKVPQVVQDAVVVARTIPVDYL